MVSVAACDTVVSGDSLGMHLAIGLRKWTVAWFGPTCEQEIDLYGRGRKILSAASCGPCWKRSCARETMCYDLVSIDQLAEAALQGRATANGERDACQTPLQTRKNQTAPDEPEIAI
jgi:heptosyltransferase-2